MRLALIASLLLTIAIGGASAEQLDLQIRGHRLQFVETRTDPTVILIDGKRIHANPTLMTQEVATIGQTIVLVGASGPGGNACDVAPFVISFPPVGAPRFDGPVETCRAPDHRVLADRIEFSAPAIATAPGEEWTWTLENGFSAERKIAFVPDKTRGWASLRERSVGHPSDLLGYRDVGREIERLVGDQRKGFMTTLTGPGGIEYQGDLLVAETCQAHNCPNAASLILADIPARRVYVAWWPENAKVIVRPEVKEWSSTARSRLTDWVRRNQKARGG